MILKSPVVQTTTFFFPSRGRGKCHAVRAGEDVAACDGHTAVDTALWQQRLYVTRGDVLAHPILCKRCLAQFALKPSQGLRS